MKERIAVVGSGLMGHGIAQIFALHGHVVTVIDPDEESLKSVHQRVQQNLTTMASHGVSLADEIETILGRISLTAEMSSGVAGAQFVFEAVFEDMVLKQQIFRALDAHCPPETILCSNTSVMSITEIASKAGHKGRIVGTHFWNPPFLIPLVEVVKGDETADATLDETYDLLRRAGKHPVKVRRDVPGFVGNRLQHALWREAFAIIDEGICDAATVDEVIRNGPGLRWPILGPVENADLVGLDLTRAIHDYILPHINAEPTPSKTLLQHVAAGELGFKSNQGFLSWTEAEKEATRKRLADYLLSALAKQKNASA